MRFTAELTYLSVVALFSCYLNVLRFDFQLNPKMPKILGAILAMAGETPHQYRILIPWLVNLLEGAGIAPLRALAVIDTVALCLLAFSFRHYLSGFFPREPWPALLSLCLFYVMPFHFLLPTTMPFFPSDVPSILFMTLGLTFLRTRRMGPFYLAFAIATLNRETTCFLTLAYLANALGREKPRAIALHCFAQAVIWGGEKALLSRVFAGNPGDGLFVLSLSANREALATARGWLTLSSVTGFLWIPVLLWYRRIRDRFVKRSLLVVPVHLLGMFCVGYVLELRIYADLIPFILTAFLILARDSVASPDVRLPHSQ